MVGDLVGDTDGRDVVGLFVGLSVCTVGLLVGDSVLPSFVGPAEGAYDGDVGELVGLLVAAFVGRNVGDLLG